MKILVIRTDNPQAEVGLFFDDRQRAYEKWQAHRELSSTIHKKIKQILDSQDMDWSDIEGIVFFAGPGSFTGLRIGATVANTLASTNNVLVAGTKGDDWIEEGVRQLRAGEAQKIVVPYYGRDPHTTTPKK